jgi:hypothetical protein
MNRQEHLQWCKDRASEYLRAGDVASAFSSMVSDMNKHEETKNPILTEIGMLHVIANNLDGMQKWIHGFN